MSHPIDVGSVLGGRYKVTATVLTSHDQDLVLDGVDQVLNRPVSILVAGPGNGEQVAQSAREVATGERPGHVQILDLGVSDNTTYLITNHSTAPDLLDLVVATNAPYVEPFFTETLGSEIFGRPRTYEPETYDGLYEDDEHDAEYIQYDEDGYAYPAAQAPGGRPAVPPMPEGRPSSAQAGGIGARLAAAAAGAGAAAAAAAAAVKNSAAKETAPDAGTWAPAQAAPPAAAQAAAPQEPQAPPATQAVPAAAPVAPAVPASPPASASPEAKVSLWSEEDYGFIGNDSAPRAGAGAGAGAGAAGAGAAAAGNVRTASSFPAQAAAGSGDVNEDYYDDEPQREPRSMRWLVGGLLAAVLVVGLILAVTNLGSLLPGGGPAATSQSTGAQTGAGSGTPTSTETVAPPAQPPAIEGITRLGTFDFAATFDKDLGRAFDGNAASYWSDMEFATEDWGGLAADLPLVVKLKAPAEVKSITLSQLGGSGGNISVYTNDRPAMDGAKLVGTNSFTSPELTMPLSAPVNAQYVIVVIKALPKLAAPKTRFGYGLRLAEVKVQ
ncbi:ABC transporter substrate-binding protein [Arthrobacter sp. CJ23]|uniref:ABC transporter substrate-binding protein n=1 Tax=Arthrobacter sp. CJ23 TaxID=2972479 RepID=UPI00215C05E6|nr:ABC transporter substrate-binding protein [Arthrobacter sp. CJ23]UVJ39620.1 ABC transporter substrate-binding protein [Arthrobacter sp. CJ23]